MEKYKTLEEMKDEFEEEYDRIMYEMNIQLVRDREIMENYFQLIIDLGYDYDGFNDSESLKGLIDSLVQYACDGKKACDDKVVYVNGDKKYNVLNEEIEGDRDAKSKCNGDDI